MTIYHPSRGHAPLDTPKKKKPDAAAARVALEKRVRDLEDRVLTNGQQFFSSILWLVLGLSITIAVSGHSIQIKSIRDAVSNNCTKKTQLAYTYFNN